MALPTLIGLEQHFLKIEPSLPLYILVTVACLLPAVLLALSYKSSLYKHENKPEACRQYGLQTQSNLVDEHDERYAFPQQEDGSTAWKVKSLWIYPIKSCRGIELGKATITGRGMEHDRQFCFAQLTSKPAVGLDGSRKEEAKRVWKFITQRTFAAMALIKIELWVPDPSSPKYSRSHPNVQSEGVLVLKFPRPANDTGPWAVMKKILTAIGGSIEKTVHIPFNPTEEQKLKSGYAVEDMEIWKDYPTSLLMASTETSTPWLNDLRSYLGITNHLALFRVGTEKPREVYRCAPNRDELGYQPTVGFQDAYPLHILNLASVHDVAKNMRRDAPALGARNFRPNIVITGGGAYAEDSWKRIEIGNFEYYVSCRTVRCLLPNVNPATGVRHGSEPNRTLKQFRRIDEGDPKNACLGMQMVPALEESRIKVGDAISVLETGSHFYLKQ